jgi:hypothetical protein
MVAPKPSRTPIDPDSCSIIGAVDALGDVWSILVLPSRYHPQSWPESARSNDRDASSDGVTGSRQCLRRMAE